MFEDGNKNFRIYFQYEKKGKIELNEQSTSEQTVWKS